MFADMSSVFILFFYLTLTEATKMTFNHRLINSTSMLNTTFHENSTTIVTTSQTLFIQGQEFLQNRLNRVNRNTIIWSTVAFASIICLISIYVAIKTFTLRKKRQTRRYKLLSNATRMEEPLFNEHDDDEDERDDDTLFVRR